MFDGIHLIGRERWAGECRHGWDRGAMVGWKDQFMGVSSPERACGDARRGCGSTGMFDCAKNYLNCLGLFSSGTFALALTQGRGGHKTTVHEKSHSRATETDTCRRPGQKKAVAQGYETGMYNEAYKCNMLRSKY